MKRFEQWRDRARQIKVDTYALYLVCRDPRVPWYAKALIALVVGYAFSPIDLIPDFVPVLGYLDDLVLVPLGVLLARRMISEPVMDEARARARNALDGEKPVSRVAAGVIIAVWLVLFGLVLAFAVRLVRRLA